MPNTLDAEALGQAQHQDIDTFNVAPGFSQVLGSKTLFTANAFVRQDHLTYTPSPDPFADQPGTVSQDRTLTNLGVKADVAYSTGNHNVKVGGTISATKLDETLHARFHRSDVQLAVSGRERQPVRRHVADDRQPVRGRADGRIPISIPSLLAFDLTRRGIAVRVQHESATIKQQAAYVQDEIKAGNATFKLGVRLDHYDGLTTATLAAAARRASRTRSDRHSTVLRASYGRTMETPYNENLLLSSGVGAEALTGARPTPPQPGTRDQVEVGVQQGIRPAGSSPTSATSTSTRTTRYDFNVLFNTPIFFPVAWDHSTIDGFTGRVNLVEHRGFSAFVVMAHTNAIYFPPGVGGVLLDAAVRQARVARSGSTTIRSSTRRPTCSTSFNKQTRDLGGAQLAVRLGPGRQLDRRRATTC